MAENKGFLWHKLSDKEKENIKRQAKNILDEFALKLEKLNLGEKESHFELGNGMREESLPWSTDEEFRKIMFANAPFTKDDAIVAEKGAWK
jgi:Asp-tRNA(Asn)/Glu-tRNA(Gln) amidotransferase C subunit